MWTAGRMYLWQLWRRHRLGASIVSSWLALVCLVYLLAPVGVLPALVGLTGVLPFGLIFLYSLAVFCFAFDRADLAAKESCFPPRLFTLPVPTYALILWPMVIGALALTLIWIALTGCVAWRSGIDFYMWAPALVFAVVLAWLQAILWFPFGLPFVRLAAIGAGATVLFGVSAALNRYGLSEWFVVTVLFAALLAAIAVSYCGVCMARRGDQLDWSWFRSVFIRTKTAATTQSQRHYTPRAAQLWMERQHFEKVSLFWIVFVWLMFLPIAQLAEYFDYQTTKSNMLPAVPSISLEAGAILRVHGQMLFLLMLGGLGTGIELGGRGMIAATGQPSAFLLARPLATWELVKIKYFAAARYVMRCSLLILAILIVWFLATQRYEAIVELRRQWFAEYPTWGVCALAALVIAAWMGISWVSMVSTIWIGLAGRSWFICLIGAGAVLLIVTGSVIHVIVYYNFAEPYILLFSWLPTAVICLIALKCLCASVSVRLLILKGLAPVSDLLKVFAAWTLGAIAIIATLLWLLPEIRLFWIVTGVVLLLPLTRIFLAPLTLAWHRNR